MVHSMRAVFVTGKSSKSPYRTDLFCQQHPHAGTQQDDGMRGAGQRKRKQKSCPLMPIHA